MLLSTEADDFSGDQAAHQPQQAVETACVTLVFAAAFLLRLWGMSHVHAWDENVYLQNAELICCGKNNYNEIDSRPPLLSLIFAGAFHLWHSDYFAWILTAFFNALGPVFLYLGGKTFSGRIPAAVAGLLLGFTPFFVSVFPPESTGFMSDDTGHSLLSDCPALTLILLGFWLLLRALRKETRLRFLLTSFVFSMAILMRFGSLSTVCILSLLLLAAERKGRAVAAFAAGLALGIAPYMVWSKIRYGGFLTTFIRGWQNYGGTKESAWYYLHYSPTIFTWVALGGWLLWILHRVWALSHQRSESKAISLLNRPLGREGFLFLWACGLMFFFSTLPHQEPRYVIPAAPPVFLIAGLGWAAILRARRPIMRLAAVSVLAAAMLVTFWPVHQRFATPLIEHDESAEMTVSDYLNRHLAPGNTLYTTSSYPDFGYYTDFQVRELPMSGPTLYQMLNQVPMGSIVIAYKQYDTGTTPPEPSLIWLDVNPLFQRLQEFPTMVVYQRRDATGIEPKIAVTATR